MMGLMYFYIMEIERVDEALLYSLRESLWRSVAAQAKNLHEAPRLKCVFIICLFNLMSLICGELNFPSPLIVFACLLIQSILALVSVIFPELVIFILFLVTCVTVPLSLFLAAHEMVSHIYATVMLTLMFTFQRKNHPQGDPV